MNKKNGFTLVELLTVLLIMGAIVVFIIAANMGLLSGSKRKIEEYAKKQFIDGAKLYLADIDNGLYGYTFASCTPGSEGCNANGEGERIGTFNYPSNNFRVMLDNPADETTAKIKTVSYENIENLVPYFANSNNTVASYQTTARLEVDNYGGQMATACDSGSVITVRKDDAGKIKHVYIWCKYKQLDDALTSEYEGQFANVKIIMLKKCKERKDSANMIGGQTTASYCTQFTDSYFEQAWVRYLAGNMIYGYEARLYMTDNKNSFTLTAEDLGRIKYYVDGKCDYSKIINLRDNNKFEDAKAEERKCRIPLSTKLHARIVTEEMQEGDAYVKVSGYDAVVAEDDDVPGSNTGV